MLRCLGRVVTIFALCCAIGLQWIVLQSVAWTTMIVDYAKRAPLRQAIEQTFDGAHPCSLCHAVSKGKTSEKKSDLQPASAKIDIVCVKRTIQLFRPWLSVGYVARHFSFSEFRNSPPVPPPRSV